MSFLSREESVEDAEPIELYHFYNSINDWYYTSTDTEIEFKNDTYQPAPIRRDSQNLKARVEQKEMTLTADKNIDVVDQYRVVPPENEVFVTIHRYHEGDKNDPSVIWEGRVSSVAWEEDDTVSIKILPLSGIMGENGLRKAYQLQCNHMLFGDACGVDADSFSEQGTITAINQATFTVNVADNQPDGYYSNGYIVHETYTKKLIQDHVGEDLVLLNSIEGAEVGDTVTIFAGCDRNIDDCKNKFDNLDNFGGFPFVPDKNPFEDGVF